MTRPGRRRKLGNRMIARLNGKVLEKHPNRVIVDVSGVGYDVQVPLSTFYGCGEPGAAIALRIHTHVREDQLALYGFATDLELIDVRKADRGQRHRPEAGVVGAVRHRAARPRRRDPAQRPGAPDRDSRRRQEDRRAHVRRAARSPAEDHRRVAGIAGGFAARRSDVGARESRLPSAGDRQGRSTSCSDRTGDARFEDVLRAALKDLSRA